MTVVRRMLVLLLMLVAVGGGARTAYACSCAGEPSLVTAVEEAEVAFRGEVTRGLGGSKYEVRVDGLIKGTLPSVVTMRAENPRASSCGLELSPGPILYAGERDLRVAQCMALWRGEAAVTQALAGTGVRATGTPTAAPPADDGALPLWPAALVVGPLAWGIYALRKRGTAPHHEQLDEGSYGA